MSKISDSIRKIYNDFIRQQIPANKINENDVVWLCNKSSNKFAQLKRRYNIDPDSFKVSLLEDAKGKFENPDIMFRLENELTGNIYLISFRKLA